MDSTIKTIEAKDGRIIVVLAVPESSMRHACWHVAVRHPESGKDFVFSTCHSERAAIKRAVKEAS